MELPLPYKVKHLDQVDFDLFSISEATAAGPELLLYVGHGPRERHPTRAHQEKGRAAGHDVEWYSWAEQTNGRTMYFTEAVLDGLFPYEVKRRAAVKLGQRPSPAPVPPEAPGKPRCEEGISLHVLARGYDREAVTRTAALAVAIQKQ